MRDLKRGARGSDVEVLVLSRSATFKASTGGLKILDDTAAAGRTRHGRVRVEIEHKLGQVKLGAGLRVLGVFLEGITEIARGSPVAAEFEGCVPCARECHRIYGVQVERGDILRQRSLVILGALEERSRLHVRRGVVGRIGGQADDLGVGLGGLVAVEQKVYEVKASLSAAVPRVVAPDAVNGAVKETHGGCDVVATNRQAGKLKV